jgi:hypothetical protein
MAQRVRKVKIVTGFLSKIVFPKNNFRICPKDTEEAAMYWN